MARVKAISQGYYDHRMVNPGDEISIREVDKDGYYIDAKGKRLFFGDDGKPAAEGKGKHRKCKWVDKLDSRAGKPVDPREVAATLSGKTPGLKAAAPEGEAEQA